MRYKVQVWYLAEPVEILQVCFVKCVTHDLNVHVVQILQHSQ